MSCKSYTRVTRHSAELGECMSQQGETGPTVGERSTGRRRSIRRVVSAGGIVVRDAFNSREILLVRMARGSWSFPKGRVERGETPEAAAEREVREEAGVDAHVTGVAGVVRYVYRDHQALVSKSVHLYLMLWDTGEPTPDGVETVEAIFVPEPDVEARLSYESEIAVWQRAKVLLGSDQAPQDLQ